MKKWIFFLIFGVVGGLIFYYLTNDKREYHLKNLEIMEKVENRLEKNII